MRCMSLQLKDTNTQQKKLRVHDKIFSCNRSRQGEVAPTVSVKDKPVLGVCCVNGKSGS